MKRYEIGSAERPWGEWVKHKDVESLEELNREMIEALESIHTLFLRWQYAPMYEGIIDKTDIEVIRVMGGQAAMAINKLKAGEGEGE